MSEKLAELKERLAQVRDLYYAAAVLEWDQEVNMPPGGIDARADQSARLESLGHELFVADEVGQLLDDLQSYEETLPYDSDEASIIRFTRREYERLVRVPTKLVEDFSRATTQAHHAWMEARKNDDFAAFEPHLKKIVDMRREWAACFAPFDNPYDPLLDEYEPGLTYAQISEVFGGLKPHLVELVAGIQANRDKVDDSILRFSVEQETELELTRRITAALGYDYQQGRLDLAVHPFSTSFGLGDVRITTRSDENYPVGMLMTSIHEAGHGMYDQNVSPALYRTGLDGGGGMALHESQSRFYENIVARSRAFWRSLLSGGAGNVCPTSGRG